MCSLGLAPNAFKPNEYATDSSEWSADLDVGLKHLDRSRSNQMGLVGVGGGGLLVLVLAR